jgi:hypothetical protein
VSDRFLGRKGGPRRGEDSGFAVERTDGATLRTGLGFAQSLGLLVEESGERPLGQTVRGGLGQLLHEIEVDVQAGASGAEGAAGNDFAPVSGERTDFLEQFGRKRTAWHGKSCLVLAEEARE